MTGRRLVALSGALAVLYPCCKVARNNQEERVMTMIFCPPDDPS